MSTDLLVQMERLRKEIDVQNAINKFLKQSLDATNARELLEGALALFPHLSFLGAEDRGAAFLVDEEQPELVMAVHRNMADALLSLCANVSFGHCLCGRAASTGEVQFASCVDERHEVNFEGMQPHGHYNVPIHVDGEIAGVIVLYLRHQATKDLECINFLETAATIVAGGLKRLAAEKKTRFSETMRRMVIENTPCGIIVVEKSGIIQIFNSTAERLFGYQQNEVCGKQITRLVPSSLRGITEEVLRCCIDTGNFHILGQMPFEIEAMRRDGTIFPIRLAVNRMEMGDDFFFIAMIVDMTEEKRLLEEVVQLERTIVESAPFGIVVTDNQANVILFNASAERLFGYRREEMIGQPVAELVPPGRLREAHTAGFKRFLETGISQRIGKPAFEVEAMRRDGTSFPVRLAIGQMTMGGRPTFVGMIADMTEEKRLYLELVQSEKMAGLGSMVAGVAHEINTPVGIGVTATSELEERTRSFAELLHHEGISEEELEEYISSTTRLVGLVRVNLDRAAGLIRSFKSVAVDQSSEQLRTFKVREYVESAVLTLHHELRNTRLVVLVTCSDDLQIRSYPGAFSQIVINLINNSRIHAFDPDDAGRITIEIHTEDAWLRFIYRDNGKGMSEETCQHIFEPFFTTRRDLGGSGLGMHIVYNLATKTLGGNISCQSTQGQGMSVHIDIPSICIVSSSQETNNVQ